MEPLISSQQEIAGRINRTFDNVRKTGSARLTRPYLANALKLLDEKWSKFCLQHDQLRLQYSADLAKHDYNSSDFYGETEDDYLEQCTLLEELKESLDSPLDDSKEDMKGEARLYSRVTLPRILLPQFSGRFEDWPAFRDLFSSLISRESSLGDVDKLHYLKVSLKGDSETLIKNLPTTGENFKRAWAILAQYYENPRLLVRSCLYNFVSLRKMKGELLSELKAIYQCSVTTAGSLASVGRPVGSTEDLFVFLICELFDSRTRREWENSLGDTTDPPSFERVQRFMEQRMQTLGVLQATPSETVKLRPADRQRVHLVSKDPTAGRCSKCKGNHFLMYCPDFRAQSPQERRAYAESASLCCNCLGRHTISKCTSKRTCSVCSAKHHTSLHEAYRVSVIPRDSAQTSHVARQRSFGRSFVLLATARVRVADRIGRCHEVRALIDQGSEVSLASESLVQRLRVPRSRANIDVHGVGGSRACEARSRVTLRLLPRETETDELSVSALVLPRLTSYAREVNTIEAEWSHLSGLTLADPEYASADPIDLILGAEVYAAVIRDGLRRGGSCEPVAQETTFGWVLSGCAGSSVEGSRVTALQCVATEPLSDLVRRFWEHEEVSRPALPLTREQQECEDYFLRTHHREPSGRYVVRLPVRAPLPNLEATRRVAARALHRVHERLLKNSKESDLYREFMTTYERLGHMSRSEENPERGERVCYLPHHGVYRSISKSSKLRVVFNGSCLTPTGHSLNQYLMTGANLMPILSDVVLRWRCHRYVLAADIEKMFRQINVALEDQNLQRILWYDDTGSRVAEYTLNTVTYGLACAPFLAVRTLKQLATDEKERFPKGSVALARDTYVDDVLTGADTIDDAKQLQRELIEICRAGCFPLKKWAANSAVLLDNITVEDRLSADPLRVASEPQSMLGLLWHPDVDCFSFTIQLPEEELVTKRSVLSNTARLFDPLGWLAPVVVRAKILLQSAWLLGLDWDTPMSDPILGSWLNLKAELPLLSDIRLPRWLLHEAQTESVELHGFCDASERAYAAVIYTRVYNKEGHPMVSLVAAKTKVAPLKQISLPRLELCGATLLAGLVRHIKQTLTLQYTALHLWTDSTVALCWIQGHPSRWKTFVANRVSEIHQVVPDATWHHLSGSSNPADCASRGISPAELVKHPLWWRGPPQLSQQGDPGALAPATTHLFNPPEQRLVHLAEERMEGNEESTVLTRFSNLTRLLRVTAWCRRWLRCRQAVRGCGEQRTAISRFLETTEISEAETVDPGSASNTL